MPIGNGDYSNDCIDVCNKCFPTAMSTLEDRDELEPEGWYVDERGKPLDTDRHPPYEEYGHSQQDCDVCDKPLTEKDD